MVRFAPQEVSQLLIQKLKSAKFSQKLNIRFLSTLANIHFESPYRLLKSVVYVVYNIYLALYDSIRSTESHTASNPNSQFCYIFLKIEYLIPLHLGQYSLKIALSPIAIRCMCRVQDLSRFPRFNSPHRKCHSSKSKSPNLLNFLKNWIFVISLPWPISTLDRPAAYCNPLYMSFTIYI